MTVAVLIGSTIGSYVPVYFGADPISFASLIGSTVGGILGIVAVYKWYGY